MRLWSRSLGEAGVSLAETLMATFIGLVAIGAFTTFNVAQMSGMRAQTSQVTMQSAARTIVDLFASEARRAGAFTACAGTASRGVTSATDTQVRLRTDLVPQNGVLTDANEDVTYAIDSTNKRVTRTDNGVGRTDILWTGTGVTGSQFTYYDSIGNTLSTGGGALTATQLTKVARIKIGLALAGTVVMGRATSLQQTVSESTTVDLRNRFFVMATACGPATQPTPPSPLIFYN
jgi:hypothetical protein